MSVWQVTTPDIVLKKRRGTVISLSFVQRITASEYGAYRRTTRNPNPLHISSGREADIYIIVMALGSLE